MINTQISDLIDSHPETKYIPDFGKLKAIMQFLNCDSNGFTLYFKGCQIKTVYYYISIQEELVYSLTKPQITPHEKNGVDDIITVTPSKHITLTQKTTMDYAPQLSMFAKKVWQTYIIEHVANPINVPKKIFKDEKEFLISLLRFKNTIEKFAFHHLATLMDIKAHLPLNDMLKSYHDFRLERIIPNVQSKIQDKKIHYTTVFKELLCPKCSLIKIDYEFKDISVVHKNFNSVEEEDFYMHYVQEELNIMLETDNVKYPNHIDFSNNNYIQKPICDHVSEFYLPMRDFTMASIVYDAEERIAGYVGGGIVSATIAANTLPLLPSVSAITALTTAMIPGGIIAQGVLFAGTALMAGYGSKVAYQKPESITGPLIQTTASAAELVYNNPITRACSNMVTLVSPNVWYAKNQNLQLLKKMTAIKEALDLKMEVLIDRCNINVIQAEAFFEIFYCKNWEERMCNYKVVTGRHQLDYLISKEKLNIIDADIYGVKYK